MADPVVAADGHTYERACIEQWFSTGNTTSPYTNEPLANTHVNPNHFAKSMISSFLEEARELEKATRGHL